METAINYLAVLASTGAAFVLGFLWFGPIFGKAWMKELGYTDEHAKEVMADPKKKAAMYRSYAIMFVGAFVMMMVLAQSLLFSYSQMTPGISTGLQGAFWNWLGFVVLPTLGGVLWESRSWKWWFITAGYYLVSLLIGGVILSLWTA